MQILIFPIDYSLGVACDVYRGGVWYIDRHTRVLLLLPLREEVCRQHTGKGVIESIECMYIYISALVRTGERMFAYIYTDARDNCKMTLNIHEN